MPKARQDGGPTRTTPTTASTTETGPQHTAGNSLLRDTTPAVEREGSPLLKAMGPLDSMVPSALKLQAVTGEVSLPGDTTLDSSWSHAVRTGDGNRVGVSIGREDMRVNFFPGLEVDAMWPASNVELDGMSWDLATGSVDDVQARNTQMLAFGTEGKVKSETSEMMQRLLSGTPVSQPGYNPMQDADLAGTIDALRTQAASVATGGSEIDPSQLRSPSAGARFSVEEDIAYGTEEGGIKLSKGSSLNIQANMGGSLADLQNGESNLRSIGISSSGILLEQDGKPVATLQGLQILPGGQVDVTSFKPEGNLAAAEGGEALIKLIAAMSAMRSGRMPRGMGHNVVHEAAEMRMEESLTGAVQDLIRQNADAVPGVDLQQILQVPDKDAKTDPKKASPQS